MRITIDAVPLLVRSAGIKNYLYYWTRHLRKECRDSEIRLFPFLGEPASLDHEGSVAGPVGTLARLGFLYLLNRAPNDIAGWLSRQTDIFHTVKLLNPPRRAKLTATIHDFTCWLMPETHLSANVAADKRFAERILKRADGLIAISESTRQDAVRILNLPPEKIRVIHNGVADEFFHVGSRQVEAARSRLGIDRPYLLFVGAIEPRKNLDQLLDAYEGLPASAREEFDLIVCGPSAWASALTMARLRHPTAGIRYLGYVPEADLPGLFGGATAFVFPSLYEGFGLPVAQAMAAGAPVITSAVSALPEVAGDAAVLIDPRSECGLRAAMQEVLTSPSLRAGLIGRGYANAQRFLWAECARKSLEFFREVVG